MHQGWHKTSFGKRSGIYIISNFLFSLFIGNIFHDDPLLSGKLGLASIVHYAQLIVAAWMSSCHWAPSLLVKAFKVLDFFFKLSMDTRLQKRWHLISLIHERQDPTPLWEMFAQIHNQWFTSLIIHGKIFSHDKTFSSGKVWIALIILYVQLMVIIYIWPLKLLSLIVHYKRLLRVNVFAIECINWRISTSVHDERW